MIISHDLIGIDVGKASLFVGFAPAEPKQHPKHYPTLTIEYKDPLWWRTLLDLISDAPSLIALESTGHHLSAPVANLILTYKPHAALYTIDGKLTARVRTTHISDAKNDRLDAIALYLIAAQLADGEQLRGARPYDHWQQAAVARLRAHVNHHVRLTKDLRRHKQRLNILAHSVFPSLSTTETYMRALSYGAATIADLKRAIDVLPEYKHGTRRAPLQRLIANLPDIPTDPTTAQQLIESMARLNQVESERAHVESLISTLIHAEPFKTVTRRWQHLPNSNVVTLAALHVATGGRTLDLTIDEFKAAVGTHPLTNTSGDQMKTRMSRKGYKPARAMLHLWAVNLLSSAVATNPVRTYYEAGERSIYQARTKLARVLWGIAHNPALDHPPPPAQQEEQ